MKAKAVLLVIAMLGWLAVAAPTSDAQTGDMVEQVPSRWTAADLQGVQRAPTQISGTTHAVTPASSSDTLMNEDCSLNTTPGVYAAGPTAASSPVTSIQVGDDPADMAGPNADLVRFAFSSGQVIRVSLINCSIVSVGGDSSSNTVDFFPVDTGGSTFILDFVGEGGNDVLTVHATSTSVAVGAEFGDGNDTMIVRNGFTPLLGALVSAGGGADSIQGTTADDTIRGQLGNDNIDGGAGDDKLFGGAGNDVINGGAGNDKLSGFGGADTLNGGDGNDVIFGGFGSDTINAGAGNDEAFGLVGNDVISGGAGADVLKGNNGQDTINGNGGSDTLAGGNSDDNLNGGGGDDVVSGGKGDDTLAGGNGSDTCNGNSQNGFDSVDNSCEFSTGIP